MAPPPRSRLRGLHRKLLGLLIIAGVFSAGLAIGRGNIHVAHLSYSKPTSRLDYSSVDQIYNLLLKDFDGTLDNNKLIEGAKGGLVSATGDPYTQFFNPSDAKEFDQQLNGSFTGIGAELGVDDSGHIIIISPLSGYPAEKAGLRPKDIVAAIDSNSTSGLAIDAAVKKIRGPTNTTVTLTIVRGSNKPFDVTLTRAQINIPSVKFQVDGNIGYLKISQFESDTPKLAQEAANGFKQKNVKAIVLDLRGDPGGYLDAAVNISSMWLDPGMTVVSERRGSTTLNTRRASGSTIFKGLPTIVLIDSGSASASEITAGALRDNNVATLLGEKSFGKGSVQQIENLSDGSEVKITIAHWYTPSGKNIDKQGITPDEIVKISDDDLKAGRDPQKDKAYELLKLKIR